MPRAIITRTDVKGVVRLTSVPTNATFGKDILGLATSVPGVDEITLNVNALGKETGFSFRIPGRGGSIDDGDPDSAKLHNRTGERVTLNIFQPGTNTLATTATLEAGDCASVHINPPTNQNFIGINVFPAGSGVCSWDDPQSRGGGIQVAPVKG